MGERVLPDREEQELRDRFRDLRAVEERKVPDFHLLLERAREGASGPESGRDRGWSTIRRKPRKVAWGGSLIAAAAAAVVFLIRPSGISDSDFVQVVQSFSSDPASGAWRSPTDPLLHVPGSEFLSTFPSISATRLLPNARSDPGRNAP